MLKQTSAVAFLLTTFAIAVAMSPGCGSDSPSRPSGTAGAGGGTAGVGTAGAGTAGEGTAGAGTAGAGTAGAGTAGAGTAGAGTAGAGTAGAGGGTAGAGTAGAGTAGSGTAGAGTAGAAPPVVTASTAILEIDDVIVSLKADVDGGVDGAVADGSVDGSADEGVDGVVVADSGVDGSADGGADAPAGPLAVGVSYKFNTSAIGVDGWHYTQYGSNPQALAGESTALAPLAWIGTDDADGLSTSGALKGTVPFQYQGDQIDFQAFSQAGAKYIWSGYKLSAKVKLVSGGNKAYGCPLSASAYISQVGYATANSAPVNLVTGQWVTVTWDLDTAITSSPSADDSQVTQMGLQINTGPTCVGTTPPDAGTDAPVDAPADGGTSADAPVDEPASDGGFDTATGN